MTVLTKSRPRSQLPGITFVAEPPRPAEALPRMDIAAFVGFAAAGPLHTPVPVEDVTRLHDVFGDDLSLAWDGTTNQMQHAHLVPTVEAFFRNGGRRCWIVRVADTSAAQVNRFPLPGLIRADNGQPAVAQARCAGSWSDSLRTGCLLLRQVLGTGSFTDDSAYVIMLPVPDQVVAGDLLKLVFDDLVLFLVISSVTASSGEQQASGTVGHWFRTGYPASPPVSELLGEAIVHQPGSATSGEPARTWCTVHLPEGDGEGYEVEFYTEPEPMPEPGDVLHVTVTTGETLWLPVTDVTEISAEGSPPGNVVCVTSDEGLWPIEATEAKSAAEGIEPVIERLTFSLLAWEGHEIGARLDALAFAAEQPRFWADLPLDEHLFRLEHGQPVQPEVDSLDADAAEPRFPLAGAADPADLYLPLGMPITPDWDRSLAAVSDVSAETALTRDGLETFESDLFFDEGLKFVGSGALAAEANHKHYLQGEPLSGLHSLWPLEEVTLVAVPDAVQRGWELGEPKTLDLLLAPTLNPIHQAQDGDTLTFSWSAVDKAKTYRLQAASDAAFTNPVTVYQDSDTSYLDSVEVDCPQAIYFRVRAESGSQVGPWSNTRGVVVPRPDFEHCYIRPLGAPTLTLVTETSLSEDGYELHWAPVGTASGYTLEEASDPAFDTATTLYSGVGDQHAGVFYYALPQRQSEGAYYYRLRADRDGETGPWSNTVIFVSLEPGQSWALVEPTAYDSAHLLALQRGLLHFCAARGDLLALLALPSHYREDEALAHVAALTPSTEDDEAMGTITVSTLSGPPPLSEERALSYAALYHPWLATRVKGREGAEEIRLLPPTGAVGGMMAAKAIRHGAWIAPANTPLIDVVSLDPSIDRAGWQRLFERQVNLVRLDPRGFLLLSADTLYPDSELRPINVRRLLILLRRLALREGHTYVFAPNSADLRRRIYYRFDGLLAGLYSRGAFAGATPAEAYQVITDSSVNPQSSVDLGRLIVELRVAPSRPLAFITVRLVQQDLASLAVQEL